MLHVATVAALVLVGSDRSDFEKLCAADPTAFGPGFEQLHDSLGRTGKGTLEALANVSPLDKATILRSAAQEVGVSPCPAADAMDKATGLDPLTGCTPDSDRCTLTRINTDVVKALGAVSSPERRVVIAEITGPGQLEMLSRVAWIHSLVLGGRDGNVDLKGISGFAQLRVLQLNNMVVPSLQPLGSLTQLQELRTSFLQSAGPLDLGFAARTKKLAVLELSASGVTADLAPLAKASALRVLRFVGVSAPSLVPLATLTGLVELGLPARVKGVTPTPVFGKKAGIVQYESTGGDLTAVAGLTSLEALDARGQGVSDLAPLAKLKKLKSLDLEWNRELKDLTPLAGLTALESLEISRTAVESLAPLARLVRLKSLRCDSTKVATLGQLAKLTALETLDLGGTPVTDVTPLAGLAQLRDLDLRDTRVTSLKPLFKLKHLMNVDLPRDLSDSERAAAQAAWPDVLLQ